LSTPAVLRPGGNGEPVRDLQRRLVELGYDLSTSESGAFDEATAAAVRAFQEERGLRVDGICGPQTWSALVESGYQLGDRFLYRRAPMLRGDDVLELQRRLNALGFDAGKEDGILGDDTTSALTEFQRNLGLATDGVCGSATLEQLDRVGGLAAGSVASVREREALRRGPHDLAGRRVFVAAAPGFDALAALVVHGLAEAGAATVLDVSGADDSEIAAAANRYEADLFLAFRTGDALGAATISPRAASARKPATRSPLRIAQHLAPVLEQEANGQRQVLRSPAGDVWPRCLRTGHRGRRGRDARARHPRSCRRPGRARRNPGRVRSGWASLTTPCGRK
jgi:N-acetylmuramoyl-L-alanine amidase